MRTMMAAAAGATPDPLATTTRYTGTDPDGDGIGNDPHPIDPLLAVATWTITRYRHNRKFQ